MTVEEYFEEWWASKEPPKNGFNKTAMLDFAEMYHNQVLRIHDVVGRSEQLCQYEPDNTTAMNCKHCGNPKWVHKCCSLA